MLGFDSSRPINCQVRIISSSSSYARGLTQNTLSKLWVIFQLVSHLFLGSTTAEDMLVDICLLGPRQRISSDRSSHVCLFSIFSQCRSSSTKRALIRDGCFVESPSGIGTELPWRLRYVHGAPALHSKSTVSQLCPHIICSKNWKFHELLVFVQISHR